MDNPLSNPQPASGSSAGDQNADTPAPGIIVPPRPPVSAAQAASQGAYLQPRHAGYSGPAPQQHSGAQPTSPLPPYQAAVAAGPGAAGHGGPGHPGGDGHQAREANDEPRRKKSAGTVAGLLVAAALVGGAAGLGGSYAGANLWNQSSSASTADQPSSITVNNPGSVNEATAVATEVLPSTVTISASSGQGAGSGTGVVLSEDGYVVTNTHVVTLGGAAGDATVRVTGSDGRIYDAEIVGTDPIYDLAVIKLEGASGMTPIEFADSAELNVGDTTVAVGAPLGLPNTVTTGIVSALNRSIQIQSSAAPDSGDEVQDEPEGESSPWFFDIPGQEDSQQQSSAGESISIAVIQTDAAINPGNSGGALVDSQGRLIGLNVAIATAGGNSSSESGSVGIGFAIPSNVVERVTDELRENGEATHGLLGASVTSSAMYEDATIEGALIAETVGGGAAEAAGLRQGDIVTAFNGVPISSSSDLTAQVRAVAAGSEATVTYVRDGERHTVDVTLGAL